MITSIGININLKINNIKKTISLLVTIILITSCSSKITLVKRKYQKGYFVSVSKAQSAKKMEASIAEQHKKSKEASKIEQNISKVETVFQETITQNQANTIINKDENRNEVLAHSPTQKTNTTKKDLLETNSNSSLKNLTIEGPKLIANSKSFYGKSQTNSAKGADTNTLVLVILSLFPILCLIAVYLKDGGITMNF